MAQRLTTAFVNTNRPGAYFDVKVKSTPVGVASSGNIAIIGEATGGVSVGEDSLKDNFFTPDQLDKVVAKYISGPIVDAFRALGSPSSDANITGSANRVYIAKTNKGEQASSTIANSYGFFTDKNFGVDGNKYSYQITESISELAPSKIGDAITFATVSQITQVVADTLANTTDGQYFDIDSQSGVQYRVYMDITGSNSTIPATGGRSLTVVDISAVSTASDVGDAVAVVIGALADFSAPVTGTGTILITDANGGDVVDAVNGDLGNAWAISVTIQGDDGDGSIMDGLSFTIRENGSVESIITLSVGESAHDTIAELAAEISALLPVTMECVVSGTNQLDIKIISVTVNAANSIGYGKSFELIDSSVGDLAAIGFVAGLVVSASEPEIQIDINRQDTGVNEQLLVEAEVSMVVGYEGGSASLSIVGDDLSTTVSGGIGADLSIDISEFTTIKDLAAFINSKSGYTAESLSSSNQKATSYLDKVSSIGICSTAAEVATGRIKRSIANFESKMTESAVLDFSATSVQGLPNEMASVEFLEGGVKGATSGADTIGAIDLLETINVNFVVPLFSRDAIEDIGEGLTDSGSTYTIAAVNAATKNHILKMSTAKIKKHRTGFLSFWGNFLDSKVQAGSLANARISLSIQKTSQVNSTGDIVNHQPWHTAAIAAGMQAAGFYKAIVNRFANVISFTDPEGFDSGSPGDIESALDAGILFLEKAVTGSKWVSDQTTYGVDTNFVYNSIQAMYAADLVSLDLAESFQVAFVGQSLADVDATAGLAFLSAKMEVYKNQKLIAASSDAPAGFKNAKVSISGPVMEVSVEIKLATAIYFIPINIEISQVQGAA